MLHAWASSVSTGEQQLGFLIRAFGRRASSAAAFADETTAGFSDATLTQAALFCLTYRHLLQLTAWPELGEAADEAADEDGGARAMRFGARPHPLHLTRRLRLDQARLLGPPCDPTQLASMFRVFHAADEFSNGVVTNEELEQWVRRDCSSADGTDAAADSVFFRLVCRDAGGARRRG